MDNRSLQACIPGTSWSRALWLLIVVTKDEVGVYASWFGCYLTQKPQLHFEGGARYGEHMWVGFRYYVPTPLGTYPRCFLAGYLRMGVSWGRYLGMHGVTYGAPERPPRCSCGAGHHPKTVSMAPGALHYIFRAANCPMQLSTRHTRAIIP